MAMRAYKHASFLDRWGCGRCLGRCVETGLRRYVMWADVIGHSSDIEFGRRRPGKARVHS